MKALHTLAMFAALPSLAVADILVDFEEDGASAAVIEGNHRYVDGVSGRAVFFDGYTTAATLDAATVPDLAGGFTVTAWIAVAAYPWGPAPIVNQGSVADGGFSFELGARGELTLTAMVDDRVLAATSDDFIVTHRRWSHVAARFDPEAGLAVFLDGKPVATTSLPDENNNRGRNPARRFNQARSLALLIGATRAPIRPEGFHRYKGSRPTWTSVDGVLDEIGLYDEALSDRSVRSLALAYEPGDPPVGPRVLPSGPPGPGPFGAYLTTLKYHPEWDALSQVGEHADIVVRFDRSPARVVFWRGTQYSPAWVTGNGLWMADQSVEGYDDDFTWEHMNDKHNRYSHVRVIENHDARTVVHWRYAPVDVNDERWNVGKRSEMGAWIDEYYTFYPDTTGVRRVEWDAGRLTEPVQFQESIPLLHPGQVQGDLIEAEYATVGNLAGETATLAYTAEASRTRTGFPDELTIQMHHFRSDEKPFIVFEPMTQMGYLWDLDERSLARPGSSSHWPVGKIWSDGRTAQAPDRATSFLGFPISELPVRTVAGRSSTRSLYGMTDRPFDELVVLARSWSAPPAVAVSGTAFESLGFDRGERAFRFARLAEGDELLLDIDASDASPLANIAIVVEDWGDAPITIELDGQAVPHGDDFRFGYERGLDGTDLVLWLFHETDRRTRLRVSAQR